MAQRDENPLHKAFWLGELDARPLRLFGALLGLVVLFDLGERLRDFHAFHTDGGLLNVAQLSLASRWSPAPLLHAPWHAAVVFGMAALGAAGLVAGRFTRWSTILTFIAVQTIHQRNPLVLDGGDVALRVLLFWSIFVDLSGRRPLVAALPVRLLQLQVVVIHFFAGVNKSGAAWHDGTALYRVLQDVTFARPLAETLLAHPALCQLLTFATLGLELAFPLLVFAPWQHGRLRAVAVVGAYALHAGIFVVMRVGLFSLIMPVALVALWRADWVPRWRRAPATAPAADRPTPRWAWLALPLYLLIVWRVADDQMPIPAQRVLDVLGLQQRWRMFGPAPPYEAGPWYVPGIVEGGTLVDVGAEVAPALIEEGGMRFSRWAKYKSQLFVGPTSGRTRLLLGRYLCRKWHAEHPQGPRLLELDLELALTKVVGPTEARPSAPVMTKVFHQPCVRTPQPDEQRAPQQERDQSVD